MRARALQTRIAGLFVLLLLAVEVPVMLIVERASGGIAQHEVEQGLTGGEQIFRQLLEQDRRQLEIAAGVLSADFGFRESIATNDVPTMTSVLRNHGARINADVVMLVDPQRRLIADSRRRGGEPREFPFPWLLDAAEADEKASGIVSMRDGKPYQMVVQPVLAPVRIAWVAIGFVIDDSTAAELKSNTGLQVSFVARRGEAPWTVLASSLPDGLRASLPGSLPAHAPPAGASRMLRLDGADWASRVVALPSQAGQELVVVLQRSHSEAIAPFLKLQHTLAWLGAASLLVFVVCSVLIARNISRPVNALAQAAFRIRQGDYGDSRLPTDQGGEIGALAESFDHMREAIATREREILRLAYQDVLTGLPNRACFSDRLDQAIKLGKRTERPFTILMMDLDRFKFVNDTLGHHIGDVVLREVGRKLSGLLRESDTVARLGGDEFAVLLQNAEREHVAGVVQKILRVLEEPIACDGHALDVGTSIGVASYPEHGETPSTLLRRADVAMYVAKRNKSGFAEFDPDYEQHREEHLSMLGELRRAVEQDELMVHYQPKLNLERRTVEGVEALLRWRHPERGAVSPGDFIPFAEQTGYIWELTRWTLKRVLRDSIRWSALGVDLRLSVNISARDLLRRELPDVVAQLLSAHDLPPDRLCLEITESALMEDPGRTEETLRRLREIGVRLSIDDYGTGYASLAYLKDLAVHELKIDRVFVKNMLSSRADAAIVRSTIELGHDLGLTVVAEGVEQEAELEFLARLGCDLAQGFLLSRPLPPEELERWLEQSRWAGRAPEAPVLRLAAQA